MKLSKGRGDRLAVPRATPIAARAFAIILVISHAATGPCGATDWPPIEPAPIADCELPPELAMQPAFPGTPDQLPSLTSLPALATLRDCFAATVRGQAWALFGETAALADDHRLEVGAIHFLAHEGNIASTPAAALTGYVRLLHDVGAGRIGMHLGTFPWLCDSDADPGCSGASTIVARYDAAIGEAAARGLSVRVMLPIAPSSRLPTEGWDAYTAAVQTMVQRVLARYPGLIDQVGMHEPTSVELLILRPHDPKAVLAPLDWRDELVDPVCDIAQAADVECTASLIPGPRKSSHAEWRFLDAAITSRADRLGVNNIQFHGLDPLVVSATAEMVQQFADGTLEAGGSGPARGLQRVFVNAAWRPAWPMTPGRPLESNAAGVGCAELADVDRSYLGALLAWARALRVGGVNVFYTHTFAALTPCDRDLRMYASVQSPLKPGVLWPNYQIGNPISDGDYRLTLIQALMQPQSTLTDTGERFRLLSLIARAGAGVFSSGFEDQFLP